MKGSFYGEAFQTVSILYVSYDPSKTRRKITDEEKANIFMKSYIFPLVKCHERNAMKCQTLSEKKCRLDHYNFVGYFHFWHYTFHKSTVSWHINRCLNKMSYNAQQNSFF